MIFRHCWGCMLEVTPSGRRVVDRQGSTVLLVPVPAESMRQMCAAQGRMERLQQEWRVSGAGIDWGGA